MVPAPSPLRHLPRLLLQHDASPLAGAGDAELAAALLAAAAAGSLAAAAHPSGDALALALGQRLVVLRGLRGLGPPPPPAFATAAAAPEAATALAWLAAAPAAHAATAPAGADATAGDLLLLGTSAGFFQIHAPDGRLLLRQELHDSPVRSLRVRPGGAGLDPADASEDVTAGFADAAAVAPTFEVWSAARRAERAAGACAGWWAGGDAGGGGGAAAACGTPAAFAKFELRGGGRADVACLGPAPAPLHDALTGRRPRARLALLAAGAGPPLEAYRPEEAPPTPGVLSTLAGFALSKLPSLSAWRGGGEGGASSAPPAPAPAGAGRAGGAKRERAPGAPAPRAAAVWDDARRAVGALAPSPCGRWAAAADSLGRVLLLDAAGPTVLRLFKGYRDGQVAWAVQDAGDGRGAEALLAIYAPRRAVVELWRPLAGERLGAALAPRRGLLAAAPAPPAPRRPGAGATARRRPRPNAVWMLDLEALALREISGELAALALAWAAAA
jgi:hypothetical protein